MQDVLRKSKIAVLALAIAVLGASAGATAAQARYHHEYNDWDRHAGWHHHHDGRIYHSNGVGFYEPGRYYGGAYPVYVPSGAVYEPYEPGISVNIPIR